MKICTFLWIIETILPTERIKRRRRRRQSRERWDYYQTVRSCEIATESAQLVLETRYPKTFFGRYDDLEYFLWDIEKNGVKRRDIQTLTRQLRKIVCQKTEYTNLFIDRCREDYLHEILNYRGKMTKDSYEYLMEKLRTLKNRGKRGGKLYAACDRVAVIPVDADEGNSETK